MLSVASAEAPEVATSTNDMVLEAPFAVPKSKTKSNKNLTLSCDQFDRIIEQYDWNTTIAKAIMRAESGCNSQVVNDNPATKDYSVGLFQINLYGANAKHRPSESTLKIPEENVAYAYSLWKSSGFQSQWGVCRRDVTCQ